jgi:hypothetical protein
MANGGEQLKWIYKAKIMKLCAALPKGESLYRVIQKKFGRLKANPLSRINAVCTVARWLQEQGLEIEGRKFFEVGTGHKPIVPIGFFLLGAKRVITVDLHRRLDTRLTGNVLKWMVDNRPTLEAICSQFVSLPLLKERLDLIQRYWSDPQKLLSAANINYLAPLDASNTGLPAKSIDCHFSVTVLEHIPPEVITRIFLEAKRILHEGAVAIHFIDLSDHFQHQDDSISQINFLRFTTAEFMAIAGNQFAYCNRLRRSDYVNIFKELSFDILREEYKIDQDSLTRLKTGFPLQQQFHSYSLEDLATSNMHIMLRNK